MNSIPCSSNRAWSAMSENLASGVRCPTMSDFLTDVQTLARSRRVCTSVRKSLIVGHRTPLAKFSDMADQARFEEQGMEFIPSLYAAGGSEERRVGREGG